MEWYGQKRYNYDFYSAFDKKYGSLSLNRFVQFGGVTSFCRLYEKADGGAYDSLSPRQCAGLTLGYDRGEFGRSVKPPGMCMSLFWRGHEPIACGSRSGHVSDLATNVSLSPTTG